MKNKQSNISRLLSNTFVFSVSAIAAKVTSYLLIPIYTSYMTTEQYGIADIIQSTSNLLYPIIMLGIGGAVMRYSMDDSEDVSEVFSSGFIILSLMTLLSFTLIPIFNRLDTYGSYVMFVPLGCALLNYSNLGISLCKAIEKTKLIVIVNIIQGITSILCAIIFLKIFRLGISGYFYSLIIANVISIIFLYHSSKALSYLKLLKSKIFKLTSIKLLKYGVPLVPNSLAWWVTQLSDRYLVIFWHGNAVNGIYSIAYKIPSILSTLVNTFIQAWQLSVIGEHNKKESTQFYDSIYKVFMMICYIVTALLIALTRILAHILFSNEFYLAWKYVPLLLVAATIESQQSFIGSYYLSNNKTTKFFASSVFGAGTNMIMNFFLIPRWGATGATIATVVSYLLVFFIRCYDVKKMMNIRLYIKEHVVLLIIVILQGVFMCSIQNIWLVIATQLMFIFVVLFHFRKTIHSVLMILRKKISFIIE